MASLVLCSRIASHSSLRPLLDLLLLQDIRWSCFWHVYTLYPIAADLILTIVQLYFAAYLLVLTFGRTSQASKLISIVHWTLSLASPVASVVRIHYANFCRSLTTEFAVESRIDINQSFLFALQRKHNGISIIPRPTAAVRWTNPIPDRLLLCSTCYFVLGLIGVASTAWIIQAAQTNTFARRCCRRG